MKPEISARIQVYVIPHWQYLGLSGFLIFYLANVAIYSKLNETKKNDQLKFFIDKR